MRRGIAVVALLSGCECGGSLDASRGDRTSLTGPLPNAATLGERHLLVGAGIESVRRRAEGRWPAAERLRAWCTDMLEREPSERGDGAENFALAYAIWGDPRFSREALRLARERMAKDLAWDSYLAFGDRLRGVAVVRDLCHDALSKDERQELEAYLDRACDELWFGNRGSGWGLDDPGNNYHYAFLEGTAHAALVLEKFGHARAPRYLDILREKLERPGGVLDYLARRGKGGDFAEGTNYGERSKQRLVSTLAAIAAMGGPEPARQHPFFRELVLFAVHQLQPDRKSLLPVGDLARDSAMLASPYERDYLETAAALVGDAVTSGRARWYIDATASAFDEGAFRWPEGLYKDVAFPLDAEAVPPDDLSRVYVAPGSGWVMARSDWTPQATSLAVAGASIVDQSHAHVDVGSFTLWKGGWQAVDASTYSRSGGLWQASAHNMVTVEGHARRPAEVGGLRALVARPGILYLRVDASALLRARRGRKDVRLTDTSIRDIVWIEPDTLVIHDRVLSSSPSEWRLHVAAEPRRMGSQGFRSQHQGGALAVEIVLGGAGRIASDRDLEEGGSEAFRIEVPPSDAEPGRYLAVVRVALGEPPVLEAHRVTEADGLDVVEVDGTIVAFPVAAERGPLAHGGYAWRGPAARHVVVGLAGASRVTFDAARGRTTIAEVGDVPVGTDGVVAFGL